MSKDYSSERGDPEVPMCPAPTSAWVLLFDAYYLKLLSLRGNVIQAWHARSGKMVGAAFDYSVARQKISNQGPIPEGKYWIQPDQLAAKPRAWEPWRDSWPESGWGNYRITIHPRPGTTTYGRGGMFIHGGAVWGSAGCVDLTYGMDSFAAKIRSFTNCHIPLTVAYDGVASLPPP